ncbi:MAG: TIM barrel protein [Pirellulaceae bacterium]|jgi:sugar phosphate isomerase/epimerase|nr:TIM barrel protein [Pirellulaceae bacterium]MDP7014158.1 TIM barrel protein [Pirellulaceae bacterium]
MFGAVTNCWKHQLDRGAALESLVETALDRGYCTLEFRQGSLGECESLDLIPDADRLSRLSDGRVHSMFNLAINTSFVKRPLDRGSDLVSAAIDAAVALNPRRPHLRLVDLTRAVDPPLERRELALAVAAVADELGRLGGRLSVEHSRETWSDFWRVYEGAKQEVAEPRCLKVCYDPSNLATGEGGWAFPSELSADDISMVHFKQVHRRKLADTVCDGDVDWPACIERLARLSYRGPCLFEVAPGPMVWDNFAISERYLREHGVDRLAAEED